MDPQAVSAALAPSALAPRIAKALGLPREPVEMALGLLAEGAQPAFVARYRRERTRGLGLADLERIQAQAARSAAFEFQRQELIEDVTRRGGDREVLLEHLRRAEHPLDLDDVRAALRKRKRGPAAKARAAGLEVLALALWRDGSTGPLAGPQPGDAAAGPAALAEGSLCEGYATVPEALAGARTIAAEQIADFPPLRAALRRLLLEHAKLRSRVVPEKKDKAGRHARFFEWSEPCRSVAPPTVLALHRAEREGCVEVDLDVGPARVRATITEILGIDPERPCGRELLQAGDEAWDHGLGKAVRAGVRRLIKDRADRAAIREYCEVLRPLLMAPPLGRHPVLAIDPGFQNGCRMVVLDADGIRIADDTVYPLQPKLQAPQAKARLAELCQAHGVRAIVVGNGGGGRDVERLCRELVRENEELGTVAVTSIDSDAAGLYASSRAAKGELKDGDVPLRRAVAMGRRVQDPLFELSKIDPRKLGLGQYQHEVDQEELRTALEQVVASCIAEVTVDLNRATGDQLARVPGISQALSKAVVSFREQNGPFRARARLLDIPGFPGKSFEQGAGFLRVVDGEHPLDASRIHPERYAQVTEMARDLGVTVADLIGNEELIGKIDREKYLGKPGVSGEPLGKETFELMLAELAAPGRDPRPEFTTVDFHPGLEKFEDLEVGMELEGIVTHLAGFGAFVDVGIAQEGLVHVSELSHGFVQSPLEAVHVGQKVRGRVIEIAPERKRFSLSLKALQPRPERPPKPRAEGKPGRKKRPGKDAKGRPRDKERDKGKRPSERTLGFRMDLSELAERLEKGG